MRINKNILTLACALLLAPGALFAGATGKFLREQALIKSVDMNTHALVVSGNKKHPEQTFHWNHQTRFTEGNKHVNANALREGERVQLTYQPGGNTPVLLKVHIASEINKTRVPASSASRKAN